MLYSIAAWHTGTVIASPQAVTDAIRVKLEGSDTLTGRDSSAPPPSLLTVKCLSVCLMPVQPRRHHLSHSAVHGAWWLPSIGVRLPCLVLAEADVQHTQAVEICSTSFAVLKIVLLFTNTRCECLMTSIQTCNMIALSWRPGVLPLKSPSTQLTYDAKMDIRIYPDFVDGYSDAKIKWF